MGRQAPHMRSAPQAGPRVLRRIPKEIAMPTITTDPKVLAARFNQAFNAHDEKTLGSLIAPNATFTEPGDVRLEGKDAVLAYTYCMPTAFSANNNTVTRRFKHGP